MSDFLIETALLTHGLVSVSDQDILAIWPWETRQLVWVEKGVVLRGTLQEYLPMRSRAQEMIRIDRSTLSTALSNGISGVLTASGTMAAAQDMGIPIAVTAGMGGVGDIKGEALCPDLPALVETDIILVATSPKDVVDIAATIGWLLQNGVIVLGQKTNTCSGFVFSCDDIPVSGCWQHGQKTIPHTLLLREIQKDKRLQDKRILHEAKLAGERAQIRGEQYHPAANAKIDKLSNGYSSKLQLQSLIDNGLWAESLIM